MMKKILTTFPFLFFVFIFCGLYATPHNAFAEINLTGSVDLGIYYINSTASVGNYVYVAACNKNYFCDGPADDFIVVDVSDKTNPVKVAGLNFSNNQSYSMVVSGNYAYVQTWPDAVLRVIDISNPTNPHQVASVPNWGASLSTNVLKIRGNYLYGIVSNTDLKIVNISNPLNPVVSGSLSITGGVYGLIDYTLYLKGNYAYVGLFNSLDSATYNAPGNDALVVDISNPVNPHFVGGWDMGKGVVSINGVGNALYVNTYNPNQFTIYDLSSPTSPTYYGDSSDSNLKDLILPNVVLDSQGVYRYFVSGPGYFAYDFTNPFSPVYVALYQYSDGHGSVAYRGPSNSGNVGYTGLFTNPFAGSAAPDFGVINLDTLASSLGTMTFTSSAGVSPAPQNTTVTKNSYLSSPDSLSWTASTNQPWCHVSPSSGNILPNPGTQMLTVSQDSLPQGNYSCTVTVSDNANKYSPLAIPIAYSVLGPGQCTNPGSGTMSAPTAVSPNATFGISCDFGSANDYIPAPTGCSWPGTNGGHQGSASTFTCTAPGSSQYVTYTCQPQNQTGFTIFCALPTPVSKTVTVGTPVQPPTVTLTANPRTGFMPLVSNLSWTTNNNPTSCTASGGTWSGSKNVAGGNENVSGITSQTTYTLTCSNGAGIGSASDTVTPTVGSYTVSVTKTQGGHVVSIDGGISCGATCAKDYTQNSTVTLKALPDSAVWKFSGWSGSCSGIGNCVLFIDSAKSVTATFAPRALNYQEF